MRYIVDTSFVIDYLRGEAAAVRRFAELFEAGDEIMINEIVVCEAATGSRADPDPDLEIMLEPVDFIQPGPDAPRRAGEWRRAARRAGRDLSLAAALIAAAAEAAEAAVLTRNVRDFSLTPVRVETY